MDTIKNTLYNTEPGLNQNDQLTCPIPIHAITSHTLMSATNTRLKVPFESPKNCFPNLPFHSFTEAAATGPVFRYRAIRVQP